MIKICIMTQMNESDSNIVLIAFRKASAATVIPYLATRLRKRGKKLIKFSG